MNKDGKFVLEDSPSLKPYLTEVSSKCYQLACNDASKETNLPKITFPSDCPFSSEQVLDADYFPE
jgi:hypothetical protein